MRVPLGLTLASAALALVALATASPALAVTIQSTGTGSAVLVLGRSAEFDSITEVTDLTSYAEGNLRIAVPDDAHYQWNLGYHPSTNAVGTSGINGNTGTADGFLNGFHYPDGGVNAFTVISATDGALLYGLEFNVGDGINPTQSHVHWESWRSSALVSSGNVTVAKGTVLAFRDVAGIHELRVGAYDSLATASAATGGNSTSYIAIDHLRADLSVPTVPEPTTAALLALSLGAASASRRRARPLRR